MILLSSKSHKTRKEKRREESRTMNLGKLCSQETNMRFSSNNTMSLTIAGRREMHNLKDGKSTRRDLWFIVQVPFLDFAVKNSETPCKITMPRAFYFPSHLRGFINLLKMQTENVSVLAQLSF